MQWIRRQVSRTVAIAVGLLLHVCFTSLAAEEPELEGHLLAPAAEGEPTDKGWDDDEDIDTISVTATRIERRTKDVPSAITVIDRRRIEGAQMLNIKDAIQGTPGVLIDSKNGGYDARLIIRGAGQKANYGVREIMVLRDGVPMTDPDSFSRFDFIDTQDIERIEITKGPGSLYGAGAAGGTIQILSKSVFDTDANRAKVGLGSYGAENYHLRYGGDINDSQAAAVTASRRDIENDWRRWNRFDTNQLGVKYGLLLDEGGVLEAELSYTEANLQLPGSMSPTQFDRFKDTARQKETQDAWKHSGRYSNIWFFNSRLEQEFGDFLFKPRLYYNYWTHYHPVTGVINDNLGTGVFGTDLELNYDHVLWGPSLLVAGVTLRRDQTDDTRKYKYRDVLTIPQGPQTGRIVATLSDERGELIERQDNTNTLYGIWLQESLNPTPQWLIDLGLRYDRSKFDLDSIQSERYDYATGQYVPGAGAFSVDKRFNLFSGRLGVSYALLPSINAFGTIAQSDQVPSDGELRENPSLDQSTSTNYELGLKGRARDWSFDTSVYYTKVQDEIVPVFEFGHTSFQNAGETDKKGFEFSGQYQVLPDLWLGGGYAYSDYTYEDFEEVVNGVPVDRSGNRIPYIPKHQYSLYADYRHPAGFKARLQANTWGAYYMDTANTEKYKGYNYITSLMLAYARGPHSLALNVENLFNKRYAMEAKKDVRGKQYYYAATPRFAMLTYTYAF